MKLCPIATRWQTLLSAVQGPSRTFHVVGLGLFGGQLALIQTLASLGHRVELWEVKSEELLRESWRELARFHHQISAHWEQDPVLPLDDWVFVTPAMPPHHPALKKLDPEFLSTEIELSLSLAQDEGIRWHAIIGSVGKSTTGLLLSKALELPFVGNIGRSLLSLPKPWPTELVVELSSFQLHYLRFSQLFPSSSMVTPIGDHHAVWHGGVEAYQQSKLVWAEQWKAQAVQTRSESFSDDELSFANKIWGERSFELLGAHNHRNLMAVLVHLRAMDRLVEQHLENLTLVRCLPHRLQVCGELNGHRLINDSKATSPGAVLEALRSMPENEPLTLILQGTPVADMTEVLVLAKKRCCHVVLVGEMRGLTADLELNMEVVHAESLTQYFNSLKTLKSSQLFSPGAPSYGQYSNYEQRGQDFISGAERLMNSVSS
jgi:UDP-N-acetylmuramoylalanine--D-glutamate ligase